jgi:hypothetical protein
LPAALGYLQPFVRSLAKLPPEELNEDVDASRLVAALRKRLRGLDEGSAEAALAKDRELLETWLKTAASSEHPAHWVLGYLRCPDLPAHLRGAPDPLPRGPSLTFAAPEGWRAEVRPFGLDLRRGKVLASFTVIDESAFDVLQRQREQPLPPGPSGLQATVEASDIACAECTGRKYLYQQPAPVPWKRVDHVLRVPGGYLCVFLGTMCGADFDELPIEARLHTLRLSAAPGGG